MFIRKKIFECSSACLAALALSLAAVLTVSAGELSAPSSTTKSSLWSQAEETESTATEMLITPEDFRTLGAVSYNGFRFTWYSEKVLPGGGLVIPGRHVDELGYVCDEDDYICVASQDLAQGTVVETPCGKRGKIYDWCGVSGTLDIYVSW